MRARATALASALLALLSVVAAARSHDAQAQPAALRASGDVQVANSRNGSAILSGALGPGDSIAGTVTISNIGAAAGGFTLGLSHLTDTPGPGGGFFSRQLNLAVDDVTVPSAPVSVYHGQLNSLNPTGLGSFQPGASHMYRLVVSWPASGVDQSVYGSSTSVEFDWSAGDAGTTPVTPPAAPPVVTPPRLSVKTASRQKVLKRGNVQASAACDQACTIFASGSLSVPGAAKGFKLVSTRGSLQAAGNAKLKLRLPRSVRKPLLAALKARKKVYAPIVISATSASGGPTRVRRKIRITG